ncbi:MAG: hypothetical protein ACR2IJ_11270 [Fluviibacter sp.]
MHNLHYYQTLMAEMRSAIENGQFAARVSSLRADRQRGV